MEILQRMAMDGIKNMSLENTTGRMSAKNISS
jgi:hypothetical protein